MEGIGNFFDCCFDYDFVGYYLKVFYSYLTPDLYSVYLSLQAFLALHHLPKLFWKLKANKIPLCPFLGGTGCLFVGALKNDFGLLRDMFFLNYIFNIIFFEFWLDVKYLWLKIFWYNWNCFTECKLNSKNKFYLNHGFYIKNIIFWLRWFCSFILNYNQFN